MGSTKRVLVIGLGIAGMATAIRLKDAGWEPLIIERSAKRRSGGYFIGLFEDGRKAAERLGVLANITRPNPEGSRTWEVSSSGDRVLSVGFLDQPGSPRGVLRGDIEAGLWARVREEVEVRFSTVAMSITQSPGSAHVVFDDLMSGGRSDEEFDLVVGADGLRSATREMVFGPHSSYMKPFNAIICAFGLSAQLPRLKDRDGIVLAEPGRSLWVFPFEDRAPTALLTYRTHDEDREFERSPVQTIRDRYAGLDGDGAMAHVLDELDAAPDYLFDSVHQVRMPRWSSGRVVLLGDSAWCLTLYSGMGATAGLLGADRLGTALEKSTASVEEALATWEASMRPWVRKHQFAAYVKGQIFVPSNRFLAAVRSPVMRAQGKKIRERMAAVESTMPPSQDRLVPADQ